MRLDRLLSNSGYGTRSEVRDLIRSGRIEVNGQAAKDPSVNVDTGKGDVVSLDRAPVRLSRYLYIALYKPDGYLTALEDKRLPTVADLLPQEFLFQGVSPVGRLDFHTTGLLLLTNDGTLSHRLTSPKWHADKVYRVTYEGDPIGAEEIQLFRSGMSLCDKETTPELLAPASVEILDSITCLLTLTEGKTHQVKRMFAAVRRPVIALHRESVGGILLREDQKPGEWRQLDEVEIRRLYQVAGMENQK